jgi:flagellar basal body rod protein FlgB
MTKMIEHTLNLPSMEDILKSTEPTGDADAELELEFDNAINEAALSSAVALADAADRHLAIQDGDGHSQAMDEIHKETLKTARDLVDLGFNVDQRSAATIFEKANMMYKTALDAKSTKRDMQLKTMKLMLDQRKMELEERRLQHEMGDVPVDAEATIVEDRNELIKRIRDQAASDKA